MTQTSNRRRGRPVQQEELFEVPQPHVEASCNAPNPSLAEPENFFDALIEQAEDPLAQAPKQPAQDVAAVDSASGGAVPMVPQISEIAEPLQNKQVGNRRRKMVTQEELFDQPASASLAAPVRNPQNQKQSLPSEQNLFVPVPTTQTVQNQPVPVVQSPLAPAVVQPPKQIPSIKPNPILPQPGAENNFFIFVPTPSANEGVHRPLVQAPQGDNMFTFEIAGGAKAERTACAPDPNQGKQLTKERFFLPVQQQDDPFDQIIHQVESHSEISLPPVDKPAAMEGFFVPTGMAQPNLLIPQNTVSATMLPGPQATKEQPKKKSWTDSILNFVGAATQISQYETQQSQASFDAPDSFWDDMQLFPLTAQTDCSAVMTAIKRKIPQAQGFLRLILGLIVFRLAEVLDDSAAKEFFFNELLTYQRGASVGFLIQEENAVQECQSPDPTITDFLERGMVREATERAMERQHYDLLLILTSFANATLNFSTAAEADIVQLILNKYNVRRLRGVFLGNYLLQNEKQQESLDFGPCLRFCLGCSQPARIVAARGLALQLLRQNKLPEAQLCLLASRHILEAFDCYGYLSEMAGNATEGQRYHPLDFAFIARRRGQTGRFEVRLAEILEFCHLKSIQRGLEAASCASVLQMERVGFFPHLLFFKETNSAYIEHILVRLKTTVRNLQERPNAQQLGLLSSVNVKALKGYSSQEQVQIYQIQRQFQHQQRLPVPDSEFLTDYVCLNVFDQQSVQRFADYGKRLFARKAYQGLWPETEAQLLFLQDSKQTRPQLTGAVATPVKEEDSVFGALQGFASKLFK